MGGKIHPRSRLDKIILGEKAEDIQHIGSTSIPGMVAKPIIDIAVLADSIDNVDFFTSRLEKLGYLNKNPEASSVERIFLRKGNPVEYHLSITSPKYTFWNRQIIFRDYLKKHPEYVNEYNSLKLKNIKLTPKEDLADLSFSETYNQGKTELVAKILKLAGWTNSSS